MVEREREKAVQTRREIELLFIHVVTHSTQ